MAERYYCEAGLQKQAVDMYTAAGKWEQAHKLAPVAILLKTLFFQIGTRGPLHCAHSYGPPGCPGSRSFPRRALSAQFFVAAG